MPRPSITQRALRSMSAPMLPWIASIVAILIVCVAAGIATRASYTDFSADPEALMSLPYHYIPFSTQNADTFSQGFGPGYVDPDSLYDGADVVVACEFGGERTYSYEAFLSYASVSHVYKGDESLLGSTIPVYEPLKIEKEHQGGRGYQAEAQDAYLLGGTLMSDSGHYVLFLSKRVFSEAEDRDGKPDEYVLYKSPFAKLSLEEKQGAGGYVAPSENITLADSLQYEILAVDDASAQDYFRTKDRILQKLGIRSQNS